MIKVAVSLPKICSLFAFYSEFRDPNFLQVELSLNYLNLSHQIFSIKCNTEACIVAQLLKAINGITHARDSDLNTAITLSAKSCV